MKLVPLLLILTLFLSSCVTIDAHETIHRDGSSDATILMDYSSFLDVAQATGADMNEFNQALVDLCENWKTLEDITNAQCYAQNNVLTMSGHSVPQEGEFTIKQSFPYTTYTSQAKDLQQTFGQATQMQDEPVEMSQILALRGLPGVSWTYTVDMPGRIVSSDIGSIEGGSVVIDMFDLFQARSVTITSREFNMVAVLILAIVVLLLFLVVLLVLPKKKKSQITQP